VWVRSSRSTSPTRCGTTSSCRGERLLHAMLFRYLLCHLPLSCSQPARVLCGSC
jgi:hypothetical protein